MSRDRSGPRGAHAVVIAGGGVAGLETLLALRELAAEWTHLELVAPETHFWYRPLAVAEPFGLGEAQQFELAGVAEAAGADLVLGTVVTVDPGEHVATTAAGAALSYDSLVLACGARSEPALPGAFTFRGPADSAAYRRLLDALAHGTRLCFAVPSGPAWSLPLYELALLTAVDLAKRGRIDVALELVTPERAPLEVFGAAGSSEAARLLDERGIRLRTDKQPATVETGRLLLSPEGALECDVVVSLPRLRPEPIEGIPHDERGFVEADEYGRVFELEDVYAVGDITSFPVKQGGIGAQQADAAASHIAARAGAPVEPEAFHPVLRGLLLTGSAPAYLRSDACEAAPDPPWWPPAKIFGRRLAPFLAEHVGLTAAEPGRHI